MNCNLWFLQWLNEIAKQKCWIIVINWYWRRWCVAASFQLDFWHWNMEPILCTQMNWLILVCWCPSDKWMVNCEKIPRKLHRQIIIQFIFRHFRHSGLRERSKWILHVSNESWRKGSISFPNGNSQSRAGSCIGQNGAARCFSHRR